MSIPAPPVAVKRDSPYFQEIANMQALLQKRETEDFDTGIQKLSKMILENKRKEGADTEYLVTLEWLLYFQVQSPLPIDEERFHVEFMSKEYDFIKKKINLKKGILNSLCRENTREMADRLKIDHEKFLTVRAIYFRECIFALVRAHSASVAALSALEKERDKPLDELSTEDEAMAQLEQSHELGRPIWQARMLSYDTSIKHFEADFVHKLILGFPKDVEHIQFCIRQIGYRTDYECARFLETEVGRNEKTEYLFRGLPSKKATDEIFLTSEKERIRKIMNFEMEKLTLPTRRKAEKAHQEALTKLGKQNIDFVTVKKILAEFEEEIQKLSGQTREDIENN